MFRFCFWVIKVSVIYRVIWLSVFCFCWVRCMIFLFFKLDFFLIIDINLGMFFFVLFGGMEVDLGSEICGIGCCLGVGGSIVCLVYF